MTISLPSTIGEFERAHGTTALRYFLQAAARTLLPNERITVCMRYPVPQQTVRLWYMTEKKRGSYSGLMRCGSVWVCPVCQAPITEQRRNELSEALERSRKRFVTLLLTYTMQHGPNDRLERLIGILNDAYRCMRSGRAWQTIKSEYGITHGVRALEVTHGGAGWHPHFHELLFIDADLIDTTTGSDGKPTYSIDDLGKSLENQIAPMWADKIRERGRYAHDAIGFRVSTKPGDVASYINKYGYSPEEKTGWTEAHEITKQPSKRGAIGGMTPLELLYSYATGDEKSGYLWREYAAATKGRSQLQWTRGAKSDLGIGALSDADAAAADEHDEHKVLLATIPLDVWKQVYKSERQAQLLRAADQRDIKVIYEVLDNIDPNWDLPGRHPIE